MTQNATITRIPTTIVTIGLDYCTRTFGTSPCLATGTPCYNTYTTCKYLSAYATTTQNYQFCRNDSPTPFPGKNIRPYLLDEKYSGQEISPQEALTINQQAEFTFLDEPDNDIGIDPYRSAPTTRSAPGGSVTNTATGDFWKKLKSRNPNYMNRFITVQRGFIGDAIGDYKTIWYGVITNIVITNNTATVTAKGLLALTVVDYPSATSGALSANISSGSTSFTTSPNTGVNNNFGVYTSQYFSAGYVKIDKEIIQYSSMSVNSTTGAVTFSGLTRGQFTSYGWTSAAAHNSGTNIQQVVYLNGNPIDHMVTLLEAAGIAAGSIDTALFTSEKTAWVSSVTFVGIIDSPAKIKDLLQELREQTNSNIWQGDDQKIKIKITAPNLPGITYKAITDDANIVGLSVSVDDNNIQRVTRAAVYYDVVAGASSSSTTDFASVGAYVDASAETLYQDIKVRPDIYSRWIRSDHSGQDYSRIICQKIVASLRDGLQMVTFELEHKDSGLSIGEIFQLTTAAMLDADGNPTTSLFQVIRKEPDHMNLFKYTAAKTTLSQRPWYIAPSTVASTYDTASSSDRQYMYICSATTLQFSDGTGPYQII